MPRAVALLRRIEGLPLTSREKQLCLLLARNQSGSDLADAMGLAASTVITHQRRTYPYSCILRFICDRCAAA